MNNFILVFLGGGLGSLARYITMNLISRQMAGASFPWHTLGVNLIGSFIIGILLEVLALRTSMVEPARLLLVTGFLGGYTTFSAFSLESALMLQKGDYIALAAYIVASVGGTIAAVYMGSGLIKSFA